MTVWPEWMEVIRLIGTFLIWVMIPVQIWSSRRQMSAFRRLIVAEEERTARWKEDMEACSKLREAATRQHEEAAHLRMLTEIALAQARRHIADKADTP